jgi:hypothetical protein
MRLSADCENVPNDCEIAETATENPPEVAGATLSETATAFPAQKK